MMSRLGLKRISKIFYYLVGFFGKVLYTGDFRWCESMRENALLRNLAETRASSLNFPLFNFAYSFFIEFELIVCG